MHNYFFPTQDSYITNDSNFISSNFGLTEIIKVGSFAIQTIVTSPTTSQSYNNQYFYNYGLSSFYGVGSGSFIGSSTVFVGTISGSNTSLSASYFSGSINNTSSIYSGSIVSSSINGYSSGSVMTFDTSSIFNGTFYNLNGCFTGTISGSSQINIESETISNSLTSYRSVIEFDINDVVNYININNVMSPRFYLNLKTCELKELPLNYTIYALAISQSWTMGTGYWSDGGSTDGVSWQYRDGINMWDNSTASIYSTITLNNSASAGGGGTWYSASICSQSFNYNATEDVNLDITPIVNSWLSGSIPNQGIILIASSETNTSGSGFIIDYFSENTNTIYSPFLDMAWNNFIFITGSVETGSINIQLVSQSISGITTLSSSFLPPVNITGSFSGSAGLTLTLVTDPTSSNTVYSASGIIFGEGLTGNIDGIPIIGGILGMVSTSSVSITASCGNMFNTQLMTGSFIDGIWSGSNFTAYYMNNMIENAILTGIFPYQLLSDSTISLENFQGYLATGSYSIIYFSNPYFSGDLIGNMSYYSTSSASFTGYFTDGLFSGQQVNLQIVGNIYTSSFSYTSSINYIENLLCPLNTENPFNINIKDLNSTYKMGDVINVYIISSEKYPSKNFNIGYQFSQYRNHNYLPTSSYYGVRDNITNDMVIDFDAYTQISCNYPSGNYFELDTSCLFPEREYEILLQISNESNTWTINTGKFFKITR